MLFLAEKFVWSMIICIFAMSVLAKPLNDAQMCEAFFVYKHFQTVTICNV